MGVGRYQNSGGALYFTLPQKTVGHATKKWWGVCPQPHLFHQPCNAIVFLLSSNISLKKGSHFQFRNTSINFDILKCCKDVGHVLKNEVLSPGKNCPKNGADGLRAIFLLYENASSFSTKKKVEIQSKYSMLIISF